MRFFNEQDFVDYKTYLLKTVNDNIKSLTEQDTTIRAILIGEFPDGQYRFITVHPFASPTHVHHPELDQYASLVLDLIPNGMNMFIIEVEHDDALARERGNH